MFDCVPLPVWKTTKGKWSISFPEMTCRDHFSNMISHQVSTTYIIRSLLDSLPDLRIHAIADINDRSCLLEDTKCLDEWRGQTFSWPTNVKVLE
jgi:hypothetical protein